MGKRIKVKDPMPFCTIFQKSKTENIVIGNYIGEGMDDRMEKEVISRQSQAVFDVHNANLKKLA